MGDETGIYKVRDGAPLAEFSLSWHVHDQVTPFPVSPFLSICNNLILFLFRESVSRSGMESMRIVTSV